MNEIQGDISKHFVFTKAGQIVEEGRIAQRPALSMLLKEVFLPGINSIKMNKIN
jgi:hypothetical protein